MSATTTSTATLPRRACPPDRLSPSASFRLTKNAPNWSNVNPRIGGAYDLFGDGKTALKASFGRYTPYSIAAVDIPANNQANSTQRTWNDTTFGAGDPRSGNYVPDCDLRNSSPNGECGGWSDLTFGQIRAGSMRVVSRMRWAVTTCRTTTGSLPRRCSTSFGRTWRSTSATSARGAATSSSPTTRGPRRATTTRSASRCRPISDCPVAAATRSAGSTTSSPPPSAAWTTSSRSTRITASRVEVYNGVDVGLEARLARGARFQAGVGLGRTTTDTCDFNSLPQVLPNSIGGTAVSTTVVTPRTDDFCHISRPWTAAAGLKLVAIYPLPWDFQFSVLYFDKPGIPDVASRAYTNAEIRQSLGRDLGQCRGAATCNASVVINTVPDSSYFEDRLRQTDIRFSKSFRAGKLRVRGNGDLYNLFNASNVLSMTTRYSGTNGGQWLRPLLILGGRMFKFSAQVDF